MLLRDLVGQLSGYLDLTTFQLQGATEERRVNLSQLAGYFSDSQAFSRMLEAQGDVPVYDVEVMEPEGDNPHRLAYGVTRLFPGRVGEEFFMTKGHFHDNPACPEVYFSLQGEGALLLMTPDGESFMTPMGEGAVAYVPGECAHRLVNTGGDTLVVFSVYLAIAGHDYGSIATKGFSRNVVAGVDGSRLIPNPRWL